MAARAMVALGASEQLLPSDVIMAECVFVLESFYGVERARVAELMRSAIAFDRSHHRPPLLLRALEVYDVDRLGFADAYLVAQAESTAGGEVLSFDRSIDKVKSLTRRKP